WRVCPVGAAAVKSHQLAPCATRRRRRSGTAGAAARLAHHPARKRPKSWLIEFMSDLWRRCLERLEGDLSAEDLHTWLMPLQARDDADGLQLFAPNTYTLDTVRQRYLPHIEQVLQQLLGKAWPVRLEVGSSSPRSATVRPVAPARPMPAKAPTQVFPHNLDPHYTFETFVEGKSNQLGKAAAMQVATNPGRAYNPLLLYGGTGLGKTHLMHAAGNLMLERNPACKVLYLRSEQFVGSMIE